MSAKAIQHLLNLSCASLTLDSTASRTVVSDLFEGLGRGVPLMLSFSILWTQQGHIASSLMPTKSASAHSSKVMRIFAPMKADRDFESEIDLDFAACPDVFLPGLSEQQPFFRLEV